MGKLWKDLEAVAASQQTLVIVRTLEQAARIHSQLNEVCKVIEPDRAWELWHYTPPSGLSRADPSSRQFVTLVPPDDINGRAEIGRVANYLSGDAVAKTPCLIHLEEPQLWWGGDAIYVLRSMAARLRDRRQVMICTIPPDTKIPDSYLPYAKVLDQPRPDAEELELLVANILEGAPWLLKEIPPMVLEEVKPRLVRSLMGLTDGYAESAVAEAVARLRQQWKELYSFPQEAMQLLYKQVLSWKSSQAQIGGRISLMDLSAYHDLAGWEFFKGEIRALINAGAFMPGSPLFPRMLVLLGLPGSGKSAAIPLLGILTGLPVYDVQVDALVGNGVLGSMENQFRRTLRDAEMVAPCILRIDEFEKVIGGAKSSNDTDGGSLNRGTEILLKWSQEVAPKAGVLVAVTMNSTDVRPEDTRSGRSYGTYFVNMPDLKTRKDAAKILMVDLVARQNAWNVQNGRPNVQIMVTPNWLAGLTDQWVPAEIELLIMKSLVYGEAVRIGRREVRKAAESIATMAEVMPEQIEHLKKFGVQVPSVANGYAGRRIGRPKDEVENAGQ